ncbi:type IV toxin-antitoxin system AbiEi family antitoxin [Phytohabitans rumicis]|uniref:AbiEi antitoxin C-terminal domain-containing protein n=1 Tax=Phytohabitans rumicis TaxID=1076125 RepID=A0A6V8L4R0_9ACTN|nr:type IV toxin-antitoxin system AbiEi family antitoxin [Phytohabitans rumicis]GFJ89791.1 hypothetical protein Prum_034330 [Phytohabitans rumicis]
MPRHAHIPPRLGFLPFRGSEAIASGRLTKAMLRGPTWFRLLPDVYVSTASFEEHPDHRMWCDAVALLLPEGAAIGGLSAAYLWGVNLLPHDAPVHVVIPERRRLRPHPRIATIRSSVATSDVTRFANVPVTTPVRTAFDLARRPPRVDALVAVDALLHRRVVKLSTLAAYAEAHRGWPGARLLGEVLALAEEKSESPMETRLRLLLIDGGLPRPVAQHDVLDKLGRFLARLDLAYPELLIGIEYEGDHHRERATFRRDVARLNALRAMGWLILRCTADDIYRHSARLIRDVTAARKERGA